MLDELDNVLAAELEEQRRTDEERRARLARREEVVEREISALAETTRGFSSAVVASVAQVPNAAGAAASAAVGAALDQIGELARSARAAESEVLRSALLEGLSDIVEAVRATPAPIHQVSVDASPLAGPVDRVAHAVRELAIPAPLVEIDTTAVATAVAAAAEKLARTISTILSASPRPIGVRLRRDGAGNLTGADFVFAEGGE